jgi:hypothetical protein
MVPKHLIGATHLGRYVLRPDGKDGIAFTLSMYDVGIPTGDGGTWVGYRLYQRTPDGDRKGTVLFESRTVPPTPSRDPADLAKVILDTLAAGPGDLSPDPTESYTPEQLEFATKWGAKVREVAKQKFGWSDDDVRKLRADLDITYSRREDVKAHSRHQMRTGVIEVKARTKREAVAEMREAIRNHTAAIPQFRVGPVSKQVYALYPHGAEMVIQTVRPQHPEAPLGDSMRFRAKDLAEAKRTFQVITRGLEAPSEPVTKFVPVVPVQDLPRPPKRPVARSAEEGGNGSSFDEPIPRKRPKGLPGGILQSP